MTTTHTSAPLAPLHGFVEALDRALADPRWDGTLPDPPDLATAVSLAVEDLPAARTLLTRAERTRELLAERLAAVAAELDDVAPRRAAAHRYSQHAAEPR